MQITPSVQSWLRLKNASISISDKRKQSLSHNDAHFPVHCFSNRGNSRESLFFVLKIISCGSNY